MNVGELKELIEEVGDDLEVRIIIQPNYPLEYGVSDVKFYEHKIDKNMIEQDTNPVLYILEGDQIGYAPWDVF